MRKFSVLAPMLMASLILAGCETMESAWDNTVGQISMPEMPDLGLGSKPEQSACKNALCEGLPEKDCMEIPYCQKP